MTTKSVEKPQTKERARGAQGPMESRGINRHALNSERRVQIDREMRYLELKKALADATEAIKNRPLSIGETGGNGLGKSKQTAYEELILRIRQIVNDSLPDEG